MQYILLRNSDSTTTGIIMAEFNFHVGLELTYSQLISELEKYEQKEGVKLRRVRAISFASVNIRKPDYSDLPCYAIEYECQYAGQNQNENQIAMK